MTTVGPSTAADASAASTDDLPYPCPNCEYDLRGHIGVMRQAGKTTVTCSECGHIVAPDLTLEGPWRCEECRGWWVLPTLLPTALVSLSPGHWRFALRRRRPSGAVRASLILVLLAGWLNVAVLALVVLGAFDRFSEIDGWLFGPERGAIDDFACWDQAISFLGQPQTAASVLCLLCSLTIGWLLLAVLLRWELARSDVWRRNVRTNMVRRMIAGTGVLPLVLSAAVIWTICYLDLQDVFGFVAQPIDLARPGVWNFGLFFCLAPLIVLWFAMLGRVDDGARGAARYALIALVAVAVSAGSIAFGGYVIHGDAAGVLTELLRPR